MVAACLHECFMCSIRTVGCPWQVVVAGYCDTIAADHSTGHCMCRVGQGNMCIVHVSLVPVIGVVGEQKTKPTQHSVAVLRSLGLSPQLLACRCAKPLEDAVRQKLVSLVTCCIEQAPCCMAGIWLHFFENWALCNMHILGCNSLRCRLLGVCWGVYYPHWSFGGDILMLTVTGQQ